MKIIRNALCVLGLSGVAMFAFAQGNDISPHDRMRLAVGTSMQSICKIDNNSRQCEIFQVLASEQGTSLSILVGVIDSQARDNIISVLDKRKEYLDILESKNELRLTKMYSALKRAQERICTIKFESQACETAMSVLVIQTDVEVGKKLNPPSILSIETKNEIRDLIRKKHPQLTESSMLTMESMVTKEMLTRN